MRPFNYHCHATYSDGKNTPEEMVRAAIAAGCDSFGISEHYVSQKGSSYSVKPEKEAPYRAEMQVLKEKYKNEINLFLGAEVDYTSPEALGYDYLVGSVHFFELDGEFVDVDHTAEKQIDAANRYFGGDLVELACNYYGIMEKLPKKFKFDIVGHFDLVTKFNEGGKLFDESDKRYIKAAEKALEALVPTGAAFEINTGAISRGYRTEPYPNDYFLGVIREMGGSVTYSSDAHDARYILLGFEDAVAKAKRAGFKSFKKLTAEGWIDEEF